MLAQSCFQVQCLDFHYAAPPASTASPVAAASTKPPEKTQKLAEKMAVKMARKDVNKHTVAVLGSDPV